MRGRYLLELGLFVFCIGMMWNITFAPQFALTRSYGGGTCTVVSQNKAYSIYIDKLYHSLKPDSTHIDATLLRKGITAYFNMKKDGKVNNPLIVIIDSRVESSQKGLWVINLDKKSMIYKGPSELKQVLKPGFYTISTDMQSDIHLQIEEADKSMGEHSLPIMLRSIDYNSQKFIESVASLAPGKSCPIAAPGECRPVKCSTCSKGLLYIVSESVSSSRLLKEETAIAQFSKENPILCMIQ